MGVIVVIGCRGKSKATSKEISTYSSRQDKMKQSMDSVILKKKENKKKWNDAYRKRIKEIKIRSILDKQRH